MSISAKDIGKGDIDPPLQCCNCSIPNGSIYGTVWSMVNAVDQSREFSLQVQLFKTNNNVVTIGSVRIIW